MGKHYLMFAAAMALVFSVGHICAADMTKDQAFVMRAAEDGMNEAEFGKFGVQHASSDDVKKFAQQLVDDHSKVNMELKALADRKGIKLSEKTEKKDWSKLEGMKGADFDRAFVKTVVDDHMKCIPFFDDEIKNGTDADVKSWATKTQPHLQMHLDMAKKLESGLASGKAVQEPISVRHDETMKPPEPKKPAAPALPDAVRKSY